MSEESSQTSPYKTICKDCAFNIKVEDGTECIHPDELGINCSKVSFCSSFTPAQEIESPCVSFGNDED
ncbi:MAG: hypothetical protein RMY34_00955 [Aulosira sp. DedQUE10]|nr:hypothetical protein [Aulosira sp. DedQUE10]